MFEPTLGGNAGTATRIAYAIIKHKIGEKKYGKV